MTRVNGGLDMKVGIGDAFTFDMTLVPDFGQVVADNLVLNLSPYEVRFNENRQFFTEGTELFNKTGTFYSRRVGDGEQLLNASKVTGRTQGGTGLGLLNAVSRDGNGSLTDFSVAVVDRTCPTTDTCRCKADRSSGAMDARTTGWAVLRSKCATLCSGGL